MAKQQHLIGQVYGHLTVISEAPRKRGRRMWLCQCRCGNQSQCDTYSLQSGNSTKCRQCGFKTAGIRHGLQKHPIYKHYYEARTRCTNSKRPEWKYYGGRGIEFRFETFKQFAAEMLPSWFAGASLGRIDNNGHYEYGNVRWETRAQQASNTSHNVFITYNGETLHQAEWARRVGMSRRGFQTRYQKHGAEYAITQPVKKRRGE